MREDVSAILFDEPLTVIDPHLKWQLRRKLKQIHHELNHTLIYVTHDQVEALTFAEQVVVMTRGRVVQIGSARELFDRPQHTFVGHFIGSPGMNFLPADAVDDGLRGRRPPRRRAPAALRGLGALTIGVRPEYVTLAAGRGRARCAARVTQAQDIGTYWLVTAQVGDDARAACVRARLSRTGRSPKAGDAAWLGIVGAAHLLLRRRPDRSRRSGGMKPVNQKAWLLVLPVVVCVAFSAILPLMMVVNYSVQDIISPERRVFVGTEWFKAVMRDDDLQGALLRQIGFSVAVLLVEIPLGIALAWRCRPTAGRRRRCSCWSRSRC